MRPPEERLTLRLKGRRGKLESGLHQPHPRPGQQDVAVGAEAAARLGDRVDGGGVADGDIEAAQAIAAAIRFWSGTPAPARSLHD